MKYILFIITISLTVFASCEKAPKCWGKSNVNAGEIVADTTLCSNCTFLANENVGFVINSEADLIRIKQSYYRLGDNCKLNSFNLNKYSLLALPTLTTCKYKLKKDLSIDETDKTYIYTIEIEECGNCNETNYRANWIVIPKIKQGYSVLFRTLRVTK